MSGYEELGATGIELACLIDHKLTLEHGPDTVFVLFVQAGPAGGRFLRTFGNANEGKILPLLKKVVDERIAELAQAKQAVPVQRRLERLRVVR